MRYSSIIRGVRQFLEVRKGVAPIAEIMPFLQFVETALVIHGLELLIIRDHGRAQTESRGQRGDENAPLLLFLRGLDGVGQVFRHREVFRDEGIHAFQNDRIRVIHALLRDVEFEEAMHRGFA